MFRSITNERRTQILRVLEGTASSADHNAVEKWRARSVENDLAFREIAAIWSASASAFGSVEETASINAPRPTAAELLGATEPPRTPLPERRPRHARGRAVRRWLPRVAALFAAALIGALWVQSWGGPSTLQATEYATGPNELLTATLHDGTVVRIAPNSRLRVEAAEGSRDVWLDGRAFFVVPERGGDRFVVRTRHGDATVLGTRFGVTSRGLDFELAVLQGAVQVTSRDGSARIEGGEVGRVEEGAAPRVEARDDLPAYFTWMGSFLAFEDTPLPQVAAEVEAVYGVRLIFDDARLERRVVTGWFSEKDPADVLDVVCRVVDAACTFEGETVRMSALPDPS